MILPVQGLGGTIYGSRVVVPPFTNSSFFHSSTRFSARVMSLISVILARVNIVCVKIAQIAEAQFAVANKFYNVIPSICFTILAPGILSWLLDFLKNLCTPGFCNILMMTTSLKLPCTETVTSALSWNVVENCCGP
jgi:hypothetical protein